MVRSENAPTYGEPAKQRVLHVGDLIPVDEIDGPGTLARIRAIAVNDGYRVSPQYGRWDSPNRTQPWTRWLTLDEDGDLCWCSGPQDSSTKRHVSELLAPVAEYDPKDQIIAQARAILKARFTSTEALSAPRQTRDFLQLELIAEEDECFGVVYLDNKHRPIEFKTHFRGTIDGCTVHPRAIIRKALELNAAAVILAHNHPSGTTTPSQADRAITRRLQEALSYVDVRMLDHVIVGADTYSFSEHGDL